jgi:hypothetical protein
MHVLTSSIAGWDAENEPCKYKEMTYVHSSTIIRYEHHDISYEPLGLLTFDYWRKSRKYVTLISFT